MKKYHNRKRGTSWTFKANNLVWLEGMNITTHCPSKKLEAKCYGPFHIIKHVGPSTFHLDLPSSWFHPHPVFNEALLTPYYPPLFSSQDRPLPPPPEVIVVGHVEYFVDSILDLKFVCGKPFYLVHWADTLHEDDTWEPLTNLTHCPSTIDNFHACHLSVLRSFTPCCTLHGHKS